MGKGERNVQGVFEATNGYRSNIRPEEIRGSLGRVLDTLYAAVRVDHKTKLFSNGLGKTLLYEILTLRRPRPFRVSISTTTNTLYDWCGIRTEEICGVVDVLVRGFDGDALAVGEIKGGGGGESGGCYASSFPVYWKVASW